MLKESNARKIGQRKSKIKLPENRFKKWNLIDVIGLLDSDINLFFTCLNQVVAS